MRTFTVAVVAVTLAASPAGQAPTSIQPAPPRFDVVSIKELKEQALGPIEWSPGRFVARGPMVGLINMAHSLPLRLAGGPDWLRASFWDITATFDAAREVTVEQRPAMIRAMLEDHFKMVLRVEPRETDVYALTLARTDGRLGPSMQVANLPCDAPGRPKFSPNLPVPGQRPACGSLRSLPANAIMGGNVEIERLTRALGTVLGRTVIDRTGLTGIYDFVLTFAPSDTGRAIPGAPPPDPAAVANLPDIFTAVREQLGLKLDATRTPLDFHIVERIEKPAAN